MRALSRSVVAALVAMASGPTFAADQTLLGRRFFQKDPSSGTTPAKRSIKVTARESGSPNTIVQDPTTPGSGAILAIFLNGSTSESFNDILPQGFNPAGSPFWTGSAATGFQYTDAKGVNGPVKKLKFKRSSSGTFTVSLQMTGKHGLIPAPAGTNTDACVGLTFGLGSTTERYSIQFGSDSEIKSEPFRLFDAKNPTLEGVCPANSTPCGDTAYPTCTGACGPGQVCRPQSGHPNTFDQTGFCECVTVGSPTDCPSGSAYQVGGDQNSVPIGCSPIPTCHDYASGYPGCAGGVAPGAVCQAIRIVDFVLGIDGAVCVPYPADESCGSFCDPSLSGGGACPDGKVCMVSSAGGEGMDCGCFTPPFCFEAFECGGDCPDGACVTCPPPMCPTPVCFCSTD